MYKEKCTVFIIKKIRGDDLHLHCRFIAYKLKAELSCEKNILRKTKANKSIVKQKRMVIVEPIRSCWTFIFGFLRCFHWIWHRANFSQFQYPHWLWLTPHSPEPKKCNDIFVFIEYSTLNYLYLLVFPYGCHSFLKSAFSFTRQSKIL